MPHFKDAVTVYSIGMCYASVCTELPPEETLKVVNLAHPTGLIRGEWSISAESFKGGEPNPCPCNEDPTRKHYLLDC